jgi:hypothetical protein
MIAADFLSRFATIADAPNGLAKLRELILQLAVQSAWRSAIPSKPASPRPAPPGEPSSPPPPTTSSPRANFSREALASLYRTRPA